MPSTAWSSIGKIGVEAEHALAFREEPLAKRPRAAGLLQRTIPRSRNAAISAVEYPCRARISSLCWPKVGEELCVGPGVSENLIGFVIVR
jgi:hypothetical protein